MTASVTAPPLALHGVDHTARPTWKLRETIAFYRDILGLPLVHVISARGWGPATHPDFLHFFFDSGNGSTIAFFYYLGSRPPEGMRDRPEMPPLPDDHVFDATHTAWLVDSQDELKAWKKKLEAAGLTVSVETTHEVIESIYVRDPNGYFIEFTRKLRPLDDVDALDAKLTLQAAVEAEQAAEREGRRVGDIGEIWRRKAELVAARSGQNDADGKVRIFIPKVREFSSIVNDARARPDCRVLDQGEYDCIESDGPIEFGRKALGLKPAIWYGLFTGGVQGRIDVLDRDRVRIVPAPR
ncbi:Glyoxalase/Bleomycin resistance protein/Dioxygenase superfamily protein [Pigmentiphaga humi]|uniref:Glyoxalase/Bleomycin resistance protein/Dioxygenase superfamily protein n=1 Tax=Pigmentiphaga humi TaxID=2478468 RepID=A0A3P4AZH2_9BURK|nr:VOC family protein [Pigmentiphaga humi]VCU69474.1 Glyoxalase/Bleomycin resistance protein/Dioxygenase superfamily protein [Pigmentiphaga humi]